MESEKGIDKNWPEPKNVHFRLFFEWLVKKKYIKGSFAENCPFLKKSSSPIPLESEVAVEVEVPTPIPVESQVAVPTPAPVAVEVAVPILRTKKEFAQYLHMPEPTLRRYWKEFEYAEDRKINFQTCSEEEIDRFGKWLGGSEEKKQPKQDKKKKAQKIFDSIKDCCRLAEMDGCENEAILVALKEVQEIYE